MTNPATPTFGHGELIRAHRLYMGLSQRELARQLPMDRRTYQRIETETEPCPVGFLDTMAELIDRFDSEVSRANDQAQAMLLEQYPDDPDPAAHHAIHINVSTSEDHRDVWNRAVIGRAAVDAGFIVPEARPQELVTTHEGSR